jgi:IS30 family transposase
LKIGVNKSTVSREIKRQKTPKGYFAESAQLHYAGQRENCERKAILAYS